MAQTAKENEPPRQVGYLRQVKQLAMGEHPLSRFVPPLLLLADALLTSAIIFKVSCKIAKTLTSSAKLIEYIDTEIDWKAYMEQVEQYIAGERDYTKIKGGTGPLVYPAAHVMIYWILYHVTNKGTNILLAQRLFGVLYLGTISLVMACYKRAHV